MSHDKPSHEPHVLTAKGEIVERLRLMESRKTLVTAIPDGLARGLITTIVEVLPERELLLLGTNSDDSLNAQMLGAKSVRFSASVDGSVARFSASGVGEATIAGQRGFVIPLPASLDWLQRRAFYRTPLSDLLPITCRIPIPEEEMTGEFEVLDLSLRGLALQDRMGQFDELGDVGTRYANCFLHAPKLKNEPFGLSLRNIIRVRGNEGRDDSWRVGFEFLEVSRRFEAGMHKLLHVLEGKRKKSERWSGDRI